MLREGGILRTAMAFGLAAVLWLSAGVATRAYAASSLNYSLQPLN